MKIVSGKKRSLTSMKELIQRKYCENNSVLDENSLINIKRIYFLTIIAIPLRIVNIVIFSVNSYNDTPTSQMWSRGIIISHFVLLLFMIGFFLIAHKQKTKTESNRIISVLQYVVVIVIMVSGIIIVTLDQMVTTNITPFLLICIVCGAVFLIRPSISLIIYVTSYVSYYFLIALTITNQEVLLSNRVNGITAVGIGFLLSIILWHYNYTNIIQKRYIELQQKQLEQMAYYDVLTDLPNRRLFDKLIKQELSSIQRHGHESAILVLDIDNFKDVNDTYGHPAGDNLLRQLAELLKNNVRESDTVSRFGGEEFIILMPKTSIEGGSVFAERLRRLIMAHNFIIESHVINITCSFGLSLLSNVNNKSLDDYYSQADKALYKAKEFGKNRIEIINLNLER